MKSHTEIKQYIVKEAEKFNSKEGSNILDIEFEIANKIVKHAMEWDKFYYNVLLRNGKVPDEIIELERVFLDEFYKEINFDKDLEKLELVSSVEQSELTDLSETVPKIISERSNQTELGDLLLKILILREKIEKKDAQSFYFKKGFNSEIIKLNELEENYNFQRTFVNVHPTKFINIEIEKSRKELQEIRKHKEGSGRSRALATHTLLGKLRRLEKYIKAKQYFATCSKGCKIGSVGFYLENEDELFKYFGVENKTGL